MAKDLQYTKVLTSDSSFQLVRTNPKLTGNVKITVNSQDQMWLDSINANLELAKDDYSRFAIDPTHSLASNMYRFFKSGETPNEIIFSLTEKVDTTKTSKDFKDQYDFSNYFSGIRYFPSNKYEERLSYFAPLYVKKEVPSYFILLKIKDPLNYTIDESKIQYEAGQSRTQYLIDLFKKASIIETFDLRETTVVGKFIRDYINSPDFPTSPLTVAFGEDEYTTWNGILVDSGVLGSRGELLYSEYKKSTPLKFFEENITKGFERNGVIFPNILNLDFIFNDTTSQNYEFNRYLGLYINAIELSELDIDLDRAYAERGTWANSPIIRRRYYEFEEEYVPQSNSTGVVVPYKSIEVNMEEFTNIFTDDQTLYFNYLSDKDANLHLPKLNDPYLIDYSLGITAAFSSTVISLTNVQVIVTTLQDHGFETDNLVTIDSADPDYTGSYFITKISNTSFSYTITSVPANLNGSGFVKKEIGSGKITLSDTQIDLGKFFGPANEIFLQDDGTKSSLPGYSTLDLKILANLSHLDEIRLYHPNGTRIDTIGKYDLLIAAVGYPQIPDDGDYYVYNDYDGVTGYDIFYFNPGGLVTEIATAIAGCINGIRNRTFTAYAYNEYVFIKCKSAGEYDTQHQLSFVSPSINYTTIEIDDTGGTSLIGNVFPFKGGSKASNNRLVIDRDHLAKINQEFSNLLVRTEKGWSKIKKIAKYSDLITEENQITQASKKSVIDNYETKIVLALEQEAAPALSYGNFIIRKKFRPEFGLLSLFPIKDIDFDFYLSQYLNFPEIDAYEHYYIPANTELLKPSVEYRVVGGGTIKINDSSMQAISNTPLDFATLTSPVSVEVDPMLVYGFDPLANQLLRVQVSDTIYFDATLLAYNSLTGILTLNVISSSTSSGAYSTWNIYQIANSIFDVTQNCSYLVIEGDAIVSYNNSINTAGDNLTYEINDENGEFKDFTGFSILKDPTKVVPQEQTELFNLKTKYVNGLTATEYDFYKENESLDFALRSKIIPYITKWGIKDGKDARENPYRLNTELVFGRNNFSPDHTSRLQNPNNFSHEWFYIESKFNYVDDVELVKKNDYYFNTPLDISQLLSDPDYFINYFTYTPTFGTNQNGDPIEVGHTQFRYSPFFKNRANQYEAFFKGFKLNVKDVTDATVIGEDGKPVAKTNTTRFDGYKFSCILKPVVEDFTDQTIPPIKFKVIEHTNFKFIVVIIEIKLGDHLQNNTYWDTYPTGLSPFTGSFTTIGNTTTNSTSVHFADPNNTLEFGTDLPFQTINGDYRIEFDQVNGLDICNLTHTMLYALKNKKFNNLLNNFSNVLLSSKLALATPQPNGVQGDSIKKTKNLNITNYPSFLSDEVIIPNDKTFIYALNSINGEIYFIDQVIGLVSQSVSPFTGANEDFVNYEVLPTSTDLALSKQTSATFPYIYPIFSPLPISISLEAFVQDFFIFAVIQGGEKYFEKLFEKISFASFKKYINTLDPIIEYSSYSLDQNSNPVLNATPNYYLEILDPDVVQNESQIITNIDVDVPTQFAFNKTIAGYRYEVAPLNNQVELNRYKGGYEPIVNDVLFCTSYFKFNKNKISTVDLGNISINTNIDDILTLKTFHHIKVADTKILDLESDTAYLPVYPKIDEVAIGQAPYFLLNSNWDWGFHHKYTTKAEYLPVAGSLRVEEDSSFLGKIVALPESIELNFDSTAVRYLTDAEKLEDVVLTNERIVAKETKTSLEGFINLGNEITQYLINDGIKQKFDQYLINSNQFIGNFNSIEDYVRQYIALNILSLYTIESNDFYSKRNATLSSSKKTSNANNIEFVFLTDQQRFTQGYTVLKAIEINKIDRLILKFRIQKPVTAGLSVSPAIKIKFI